MISSTAVRIAKTKAVKMIADLASMIDSMYGSTASLKKGSRFRVHGVGFGRFFDS